MGTKIVGMGTHSTGTGQGWGLTQWGRGGDGDRDGWGGDKFLSRKWRNSFSGIEILESR